ncbi:putative NACHT [Triplophysa rosa]|uniref:NACHT n=1 Tax=Triplophysa rosa TaxID=992332 RepID=A0A9W7X0P3_TRIRA|nr:putative NACHT [Triplophysa rosa]
MDHDATSTQFVDAHWATLVQRVDKAVMPIADEFWSNGMLGWESYYEYKKWIQREYEFVTEYNSRPGEHVLLSERYIQPLIIMRHREKKERTEELCCKGESFQQLISSENNVEKENNVLDALFSADSNGIWPGAVILQGNSGKGKSVTAQKIMLDWASGNLSRENFDCVFHLKCKELNQISEEQSLVEILSINSNLTPDQILQILQMSPKRVLVLIDGFDELKVSNREASNKSTATDTMRGILKKPQRLTEIIGFSEREVEEYFQKFFQDEELFRNAYESVKANETLFTACSSPVICWIICTVIRERFNDGTDVTSGLETTTSIYVDFVFTLLEHHCQGLSESVPTLLKSLGQLAERGVMERHVLFDEKSVKKTVSDPSGSPFLGKFLFKKRTRQETMFSFMHLSVQEFFTALYYVLDEKQFCGGFVIQGHIYVSLLLLDVQKLADTDVSDLISALGEGKFLTELRLMGEGLSDQSVLQILHALHKQKTVGGLQIAVKNITADTALILTDFIQSTEKWEEIRSAGFDQQVDSLLSHLSSLSGLSVIIISAPLLTEKWASRILFLIQSCSSLTALSFNAGSLSDNDAQCLLMEEGIRLLKESPKHPQYALNMKRHRCKPSDCCRHQNDQIEELDCNQSVTIDISRENSTKESGASWRLIRHFTSYFGCDPALHALGVRVVRGVRFDRE